MNESFCYALACRESFEETDWWSKEDGANDAVYRALGRGNSWRTPPHWSRRDWLDEVRAIVHSGAACAHFDYDASRGVPLRAHIYIRAIAAVWTRYRQEWSYYLHSVAEFDGEAEAILTPFDEVNGEKAVDHSLDQALRQLSVEDQLLIHQLFWDLSKSTPGCSDPTDFPTVREQTQSARVTTASPSTKRSLSAVLAACHGVLGHPRQPRSAAVYRFVVVGIGKPAS